MHHSPPNPHPLFHPVPPAKHTRLARHCPQTRARTHATPPSGWQALRTALRSHHMEFAERPFLLMLRPAAKNGMVNGVIMKRPMYRTIFPLT